MNDVCCLVLLCFDGTIQCNHTIKFELGWVGSISCWAGLGWVKKYGPISISEYFRPEALWAIAVVWQPLLSNGRPATVAWRRAFLVCLALNYPVFRCSAQATDRQ